MALLPANADNVPKFKASRPSRTVEREINDQSHSVEERGQARWKDFSLGRGPKPLSSAYNVFSVRVTSNVTVLLKLALNGLKPPSTLPKRHG